MPWVSRKQQKWGNSPAGRKALGTKGVQEWNDSTAKGSLRGTKGSSGKKETWVKRAQK